MKPPPPLAASRAIRVSLVEQARRERPRECCGLLVGDGKRIDFAVPLPNIAADRARYRIDDVAHIELRRMLRRFVPQTAIVGVYHSHPAGGAWPSATDIAEAFYPEWAYVIVGLGPARPAVRAFRIRSGRVRELAIRWR